MRQPKVLENRVSEADREHYREKQNNDRFEISLESTPDLRAHVLEGPPLKAITQGKYPWMDGYHWLLAAAAHTERHTKQILAVKAAADFPVN